MALYITGDTHGVDDIQRVVIWYQVNEYRLTEDDILIICGDTCIDHFYGAPEHKQALPIFDKMKITVAYVDGNHENFEKLNSREIEEWNGGKIHRHSDNVIHLIRGQIYNIDGVKILTIGGATSPDKNRRILGLDYFKEEDIQFCDTEEALNNLEKHNNEVDLIITHTIGKEFIYKRMYRDVHADENYMGAINNFLDYINDIVKHKAWYFGHFHMDIDYIGDNKYAVFNRIVKIQV